MEEGRRPQTLMMLRVDVARDAVDVCEPVELPDDPSVDARPPKETEGPKRVVDFVPHGIASFPIVSDVDDDLAIPGLLDRQRVKK